MKKSIFGALAIASLTFAACNNSGTTSKEGQSTADSGAAAQTPAATSEKAVTEITPQFTDIDSKVAASLNTVIDQYLAIKNGLAADNAEETAKAGKAMAAALAGVDASLLTTAQQPVFAENKDELKEHAEHISENAGNIHHQREHFVDMSEDVYALVKAFGGGRPLYRDFCPMANEDKGARWLSEVKDIKNPYFGSKMLTCGSVEEVIK